jgi:hypothetical protein
MLKLCLWTVILLLTFISPAQAATCRAIQDQTICIVEVSILRLCRRILTELLCLTLHNIDGIP